MRLNRTDRFRPVRAGSAPGAGRRQRGLVRALLLAAGAGLTLPACMPPVQSSPSDADRVLARHVMGNASPADPGSLGVRTLYYGSGTDRHRPEYRDSVAIVTDSVDGSKLVSFRDRDERHDYWGFTAEGLPVNGRVWYPAGEGPFPLVLVVHGNHNPRDFSDPGYDYLGELLASRGFILASVDMNFLNGNIREENDGRGWMLLKHLEAWERFNAEPGGPMEGLVDMSRIGLMGHSRGGEAVGHAAAFNRLSRYPDDATVEFDFGFDIRGIVAIAPVDGQYLPTGRKVPVQDVNYLVFHGSHDGDVTSFHGLRQWDRVSFSPGSDYFKSAIYMYRANHGQWNTVWNSTDCCGSRGGRVLDLSQLVAPEDQRRFAEIYVTAFLEVTLNGRDEWLPLFRDHRVAGEWLPPSMYVTRLQHGSFTPWATFEEDIDVTSGTLPGVAISGTGLKTWKEEIMLLRSSNRANTSSSQENQAVRLGWGGAGEDREAGNRETEDREAEDGAAAGAAGGDEPEEAGSPGSSDEPEGPPVWELRLSETTASPALTPDHSLTLSLNSTGSRRDGNTGGDGDAAAGDGGPEEAHPPLDLSVEVEDATGRTARLAVGDYAPIRDPLKITVLRRRDREAQRGGASSELVLQSVDIPVADFVAANPDLDPASIRAVRLVFDRSESGEVVVDDVGFSLLPPGYWSARIPRTRTP
jgi:dienelactone hydrolase